MEPWIILGDFNIIRNFDEKIGSEEFEVGAMEEFNETINRLDAYDYPTQGFFFT